MYYVALLRGINVGGNNKVSMPALKKCFEDIGFTEVSTYINSGNVLFEFAETELPKLVEMCEAAIRETFGFHVICSVVAAQELVRSVEHAPRWWGKPDDDKHNALFIIAPKTPAEIMKSVGEAKPEYEKVAAEGPIIFWTAPFKTYNRTRYSKIVGTDVYKYVTIRNANTTKKLMALCQERLAT